MQVQRSKSFPTRTGGGVRLGDVEQSLQAIGYWFEDEDDRQDWAELRWTVDDDWELISIENLSHKVPSANNKSTH